MAIKTIITLEDDLDGTKAEETIAFTLDGVSYHIDLSAAHAEELRGIFGRYAEAGRKLKASNRSTNRASSTRKSTTAEVREWAQKQGLPVSARGRVQADIIEKYNAATD